MKKMKTERDYSAITKVDPEKYCAYCGKVLHRVRFASGRLEDLGAFTRRKYCNRECMKKAFVKTDTSLQTYRCAHQSAYRLAYDVIGKEKVCEVCGSKKNIDVHHIDGDYRHNDPSNLMVVCRSCHMKIHKSLRNG